jgi:hypothetical protein
MSPQSNHSSHNTGLGSLVAALFMISFTAVALFFMTGVAAPKASTQRVDLVTTCSMWHLLNSSPSVHPTVEMTSRMTVLCP